MPPKRKNPPAKEVCCVCCQVITIGKDDALFCSGNCQQWLHRYCASVSVKCFKDIKEKDTPFLCFCCNEGKSQREIATLKNAVELLKLEIRTLKDSLSAAHLKSPHQESQPQRSYATAASSGESSSVSTVQAFHAAASGTHSKSKMPTPAQTLYHHDRKFNVIVYGIDECPKGTPKHARSESDLRSVISVLSKVDNSVESLSIRDVYRLGRYNSNPTHPRPILVKFIRAADVSSILSKKGSLSHPLVVKPDLSPEERRRDSVLLKERWSLIQSGIPRSDIKIRESRLYVRKKLFGYYDKSEFQYSSSASKSLPESTDLSQSDVQTPRDNTPLSHNAPPFVPENSIVESQSPPNISPTVLTTDHTCSLAQPNVMHTSTQPQSPSHSLSPPAPTTDSI